MLQAYWDALLRSAPWLGELFPWFDFARNVWHSIESFVLFCGFVWISHRLKFERRKMAKLVSDLGESLDEKINTAAQLAKAARDTAESAAAAVTPNSYMPSGSLAHWEQLRSEWHDIRDRIEMAIKRIKNARVRGKYANYDRYSYHDIIVTLGRDEQIPRHAEIALISMNNRFMTLKSKPSQTTSKDVSDFTAWKKAANSALPRLPKPSAEGPQPPQMPLAAE